MQPKLILDIRYFESDVENVAGNSLPSNVGRIYQFPQSIHALGARIARKLREEGFATGSFDHFYIAFTPLLPDGQVQFSVRKVEPWLKYIDYGVVPSRLNGLSDVEKELFVESATFNALGQFASGDSQQSTIVRTVEEQIRLLGSELEITHKTKDTKSYAVTVTYQIQPKHGRSVGLIRYLDKKSGKIAKGQLVELEHYEDIFFLVDTISVSQGIISLKPRASFKASMYTKDYKVPIEIPVSALQYM